MKQRGYVKGALSLGLAAACLLATGCDESPGEPGPPRWEGPYLLGAHYYAWYPSNFEEGTLREQLAPPQTPALGRYASSDPQVAAQQIDWAADSGIDFFTLNYWPTRPQIRRALEEGFLAARNRDRIRHCLFYGTGELGAGYDHVAGVTVFDAAAADMLVRDMRFFADRYFADPGYLRIDGRPVIVFYSTRIVVGEFEHAFTEARRVLQERGIDPYFIGDEIFWDVRVAVRDVTGEIPVTPEPQAERIRLFDAIMAYSLIYDQRPRHGGYLAESTYLEDVEALLQRYRDAVPDVPIMPTIMPGYNDRGTRPDVGNPIIPRQAAPGEPVTSGFELMYDHHLLPNLDGRAPVGFITSWNEWNEDTAIEPLTPAEPAGGDPRLTGGYPYTGYGTAYLDTIRRRRLVP